MNKDKLQQLHVLLEEFYNSECSIVQWDQKGPRYLQLVGTKLDEVLNVSDWVKNRIASLEYSHK